MSNKIQIQNQLNHIRKLKAEAFDKRLLLDELNPGGLKITVYEQYQELLASIAQAEQMLNEEAPVDCCSDWPGCIDDDEYEPCAECPYRQGATHDNP